MYLISKAQETYAMDSDDMRDFVSSAQTLLEQFKDIHVSDYVVFRVVPLPVPFPISSEGSSLAALTKRCLELYDDLHARMQRDHYIWFKEAPLVRAVIQPVPMDDTTEKMTTPLCYVEGTFRVGDYIDDEWFMVRLLLEMTHSLSDVCASIVDSDGQFLLIETANYIPDWLEPENGDNRVWLSRGKLHILPREAGGQTKAGAINLVTALQYLHSHGGAECSQVVQSTLRSRIDKISDAQIRALKHKVVCYLPHAIALLVENTPGLVSAIVEELGKPSLRHCNGGEKQSVVSNASLWRAILGDKSKSSCLCVCVNFTRPLFAKLVFKPFRAPSVLSKYRVAALTALASSGEDKAQAAKNVEVSCRLLVGIALLMRAAASDTNGTTAAHSQKCNEGQLALLRRYSLSDPHLMEAVRRDKVDIRDHALCAMTTTGDYLANEELSQGEEKRDSWPFDRSLLLGKGLMNALFYHKGDSGVDEGGALEPSSIAETDSDSWLKLSEQQFQSEMESRAKTFTERGSAPPPDVPPAGNTRQTDGEEDDLEKVDNLVESVRHFVSDPNEGVGGSASDNEEEDVGGPLDSLSLDMAKVLSIVDAVSNGENVFPSQSQEIEQEQEEYSGVSKDDGEEGLDFDEYQEAMERELQASSMVHTFERGPPSLDNALGEVDIDKNLMQNLLEAHASQEPEGIGPAAHLLSLLGSQFPDPDAESESESDDEDN